MRTSCDECRTQASLAASLKPAGAIASSEDEICFSKKRCMGKEGITMRFRYWLEEITRIRLEDAMREAGLWSLSVQSLVPSRADENQRKEAEVTGTELHGENGGSSPDFLCLLAS